MKTHELKLHPEYFDYVLNRTKTFEVRVNDRKFCYGDTVVLKEWDPSPKKTKGDDGMPRYANPIGYSGREVTFMIGYIYGTKTFQDGFEIVVFSLLEVV